MFTGIVEKTLRVVGVADGPRFRRLTLAPDWGDTRLGQSIAVNGCCLTVAELGAGEIGFDVVMETLEKTNLGLLQAGDSVNVERSIRAGERIDGHFVQGHIDGRAVLLNAQSAGQDWRLSLEVPPAMAKYIVPKGSVALDGVSLTVALAKGNFFEVALIPTTLKMTNLGTHETGWPFNLEADIVSKTIVSWLERQEGGKLLGRETVDSR
jgi:riboflavin synthase